MECRTVTVQEAATMLGVGRTLVRTLIARGEIPAIKLGDRTVIAKRVIEAILRGEDVRQSA